jgi:hypothetical protein
MLRADLQMDTKARGSRWVQIYNFFVSKPAQGQFSFWKQRIEKYWHVNHELIGLPSYRRNMHILSKMQPTVIKEHELFTVRCAIYLATISVYRQYFVSGIQMYIRAEHWRIDSDRVHRRTRKNLRSNATLSACVTYKLSDNHKTAGSAGRNCTLYSFVFCNNYQLILR